MGFGFLKMTSPVSNPFLSPDDVRKGLEALVSELEAKGASSTIYIVGGAAVMIQAGREALSRDVDAFFTPTSALVDAISVVAQKMNWPGDWLNNAVNMFASHHDTNEDWSMHIARRDVVVWVANCSLLLAMKLHAARGRDAEDIDLLVRACKFTELQQAIAISFGPSRQSAC